MRALDRLFNPKSIAVIGGGAWCASVIDGARAFDFTGDIWPVHPTRTEIAGAACVADLADLPSIPDAAFIGVNRHATVTVTAQLAQIGAGGAVCFASGFSEAAAELADGGDLQAELVHAAGDMPILGPNCYGLINALDGAVLWPDLHGATRCDSGVAIITQSSNIAINLTMQQRALPVAYVATAGNQAQTDMAALARHFLADPRVTALGLHIEGIGDLAEFVGLAAEAAALGKPIVGLKLGVSSKAQSAMISHTASLAGDGAAARALFKRLGIAWCHSPSSFLEALKIVHMVGRLPSNKIASMSCSGGEASLMADMGEAAGLVYPDPSKDQITALRSALGPKVALANPLDYHTYIWGDRAAMAATFTAMLQGDVAMGCVVLDVPRLDRFSAPAWDRVIEAAADARTQTGKPIALLASIGENMPESMAQKMTQMGVIPLSGMHEALEAIAAIAAAPVPTDFDVTIPGQPRGSRIIYEAAAKSALAEYGLPLPQSVSAQTAAEAAGMAAQIGFPVVLKADGLAHKSESGGVALNLCSAEAVQAAAQTMNAPTFLVEQMITGSVAELLIGIRRDDAHGFALTIGAGGTLTELWRDTVTLTLPATASDIETALRGLRMKPLLDGFRGAPAADTRAITAAIMAAQSYALAHKDKLIELEVNPLLCLPNGAIAADALIQIGE